MGHQGGSGAEAALGSSWTQAWRTATAVRRATAPGAQHNREVFDATPFAERGDGAPEAGHAVLHDAAFFVIRLVVLFAAGRSAMYNAGIMYSCGTNSLCRQTASSERPGIAIAHAFA